MEVLTEEQMRQRLSGSTVTTIRGGDEEPGYDSWPVRVDHFGDKFRISVSKAREVAADLLRQCAEADKRELRKALDDEKERSESYGKHLSQRETEIFRLQTEVKTLRARVRKLKRRA